MSQRFFPTGKKELAAMRYVRRQVLHDTFGSILPKIVAPNTHISITENGQERLLEAATFFLHVPDELLPDAEELVFKGMERDRFLELETTLNKIEDHIGREVPYHEAFHDTYPDNVARCGLPFVVDQLASQCKAWHRYPFFNAVEGGYQYLHDLLVEARHRDGVNGPSIERALVWLTQQLQSVDSSPADSAWAGLLSNGYSVTDLVRLLQSVGLVQPNGSTPTADTKPGAWVGVIAALREKSHLPARESAALARALHQTFGPVVSERLLQDGMQADNEVHRRAYTRALAFIGG